jgi:hypothetical protein
VTIEYVVPEVVVETIEYITGTPFETVEAVEAVETVEVTEPTVTEPTVTEQMVANGSADVKQAVQVPAEVVRQAVVEPKAVTPKSEKADNSLAYTGAGDPLPIGLAGLSLVALDAMLARRKRTAPHN